MAVYSEKGEGQHSGIGSSVYRGRTVTPYQIEMFPRTVALVFLEVVMRVDLMIPEHN